MNSQLVFVSVCVCVFFVEHKMILYGAYPWSAVSVVNGRKTSAVGYQNIKILFICVCARACVRFVRLS